MAGPRIALVHDWMTNMRGGERVLVSLHKAFPEAPIFTSVYRPEKMTAFEDATVHTSFLQGWPLAPRKHQLYPLLRPMAMESFDFSEFDLIISSSSAESKGIVVPPRCIHINYQFTPTRYYWSGYEQYLAEPGFGGLNPLVRLLLPRVVKRARQWDYAAAQRPDYVVAISSFVAERIKKYYHREATVLYPPVDTQKFRPVQHKRGAECLVVSSLVPYKRVDLAVVACTELGLPLRVVGRGPELSRLRALAGNTVHFETEASDERIAELYANARAFIFTPEEDFGITPLEAMASGTPVIAYGAGGALETVVKGKTGSFFTEQTVASLKSALEGFDPEGYVAGELAKHADTFSEDHFIRQFHHLAKAVLSESKKPS